MDKQRTIKSEVRISGVGLHTGKTVEVKLKPAKDNEGIKFRRIDLKDQPVVEANAANILQTNTRLQRTSIKKGSAEVHTIEHLLAALSGLGVDNILVDINGPELPGLDGSSGGFAEALAKAGIEEQNSPKTIIEITEKITCRGNGSLIEVFPDSKFSIDYFLEFKNPGIKKQSFSIKADSSKQFGDFFKKELASARTFSFVVHAIAARIMGLGKGASFKNTVIMWRNRPLFNRLRFSNEAARHKALDLLGDLYLLGGHIRGHVIAKKSGHTLNTALVKEIAQRELYGKGK